MSEKKILFLYGSRYGSTEQIVKKMSEICKLKNVNATIINLKTTPNEQLPKLEAYNGIIIGTGIQVDQWVSEVKKFTVRNKDKLNELKGPVGFFISAGFASFPEQFEETKKADLIEPLAKMGIKTKNYEAFGGVFDFSKNSPVPWISRNLVKMIIAKNDKIDKSGYNDFRDWDKIQNFTMNFLTKI